MIMAFVGRTALPSAGLRTRGCRAVRTRSRTWSVAEGATSGNAVVDMDAYAAGFESVENEEMYEIDYVEGGDDDDAGSVEGVVPTDLSGTLYRVMPGRRDAQETKLENYFDGDGMVFGLSFSEGKLFVRNRFIRTKAFDKERRLKKMIYRGLHGSLVPGGGLSNFAVKVKLAANKFGVLHGGRLLALHDWGLPYSIDPSSLLTRGRTNIRTEFSNNDDRMIPSARFDSETGNLVLASKTFSSFGATVSFVEFDDDYRKQNKQTARIRSSGMIPDFALTDRYYIVILPPTQFDSSGFYFGVKKTYAEAMSKRGSESEIVLVDRKTGKVQTKKVETGSLAVGKIANAFERSDGTVVVDAICHDGVFYGQGLMGEDYAKQVPLSRLTRLTVDPSGSVKMDMLSERHADYSVSNSSDGSEPTDLYALCAGADGVSPMTGIMRYSVESGEEDVWQPAEPNQFCSAPAFVAGDDSEAESYVVTVMYDGAQNRSSVLVFNGKSLSSGPVCRIHLKNPVPHGITSTWSSRTFSLKDATKFNSYEIFKSKGWNSVDSGFSLVGLQGLEDEF